MTQQDAYLMAAGFMLMTVSISSIPLDNETRIITFVVGCVVMIVVIIGVIFRLLIIGGVL